MAIIIYRFTPKSITFVVDSNIFGPPTAAA